ncbi:MULTISPECIES: DUF6250 domain-containing protein [Sphingobacterium]|uniref:Methyltransferase n=1 Tax=Sphingobacterium athyrii TaxID=2152717 RepID=A0A363NX99_9SPHI|nr:MULTISPECIES: DUF6250 domain-containing protein [Sphingobacterium]PUV25291.1 methyltransferase [Sphingobacterium athyrii]QIH34579.1 methyltransferase [Sphingobacterium sp. DR205]
MVHLNGTHRNKTTFPSGLFKFSTYPLSIVLLLLTSFLCNAQQTILYQDSFDKPLDTLNWKVEMLPGNQAKVITENQKLVINAPYGVTVWFRHELTGPVRIEYDWKVVIADGINDRLSDLNQFWMATDPRNEDLFTRRGKFSEYDSLSLYYIGMGGNKNTTTRFRKYQGNGERKLLHEYTDKSHLLKPNHNYHIIIEVANGMTRFLVDGVLYFSFADPELLTKGYFGFRSTHARHEISNFRVLRP